MEQTHFFHNLFILLPLLLSLILILKNRLFQLSKLQVITILILGTFIAIHENPGKLLFTYHHQGVDTHQQKHTCCMPLISDTAPYIEIVTGSIFVQYVIIPTHIYDLPLIISSIKDRSPPVS